MGGGRPGGTMSEPTGNGGPLAVLGRLLCLFGVHDYQVITRTFGFGGGGGDVEKVECRRCGHTTARKA
jgi:hypothetical protein